jgi:hypothetical protein
MLSRLLVALLATLTRLLRLLAGLLLVPALLAALVRIVHCDTLIRVCVERKQTPAHRHTFIRSSASRFQPLVLIRLDVIGLLRATKNLLRILCVIRLNEQIKRSQATRDRRKHGPSASI